MTPEDFEKIALWMGWEKKHFGPLKWFDAKGQSHGQVATKASLTDTEAVEALNRLVEKGYGYSLETRSTDKTVCLRIFGRLCATLEGAFLPSIHAAVEQAILELAKREG